ncbi:MAG: MFS transporter [Lachnospiraceae bacterium]|nr:MFS transporter [Lachnospiraceae bacterium]
MIPESGASYQEKCNLRQKNAGFFAFFLSGICAISSSVVVSLLQGSYGFAYGMTGTLLSLMSAGNLLSGFLTGLLPGKIGTRRTVTILTVGYAVGYLCMGLSGWMAVLMLSFFLAGMAKGCTINTCTILVGDNSEDRTRGMNVMHACYAFGALLCPFFIAAAAKAGSFVPLYVLAAFGFLLWLIFFRTPLEREDGNQKGQSKTQTDWSFLKSKKFWLLTGLIFCQNAAEFSVNGWMVTYFKDSGIISGMLSTYTVTVMWTATLIGRLLIAFVFPIKDACRAMIRMSLGCIVFYLGMMLTGSQVPAILLLFAFAFSMAGMNPTAVASAGRMTSAASIGVMLPVASIGAIVMPWIAGVISEYAGLKIGMVSNVAPCVGLLVFAVLISRIRGDVN